MKRSWNIFEQPDLMELLRDRPELYAFADAIAETQMPSRWSVRRPLWRRGMLVIAATAALIVVGLLSPWSGGDAPSVVSRAAAAVGDQPVLHVVGEMPTGVDVLDLSSGNITHPAQQIEIWFDQDRGLERTTTRSDAQIVYDVLETPQGSYTPQGVVYDCSWIAAHPVQATQANVSCNASGQNGTTPHVIPRPTPTLQPGLTAFLDGYRAALANGTAREIGPGDLAGKPVTWLAFQTQSGDTERVALDPQTYRPLFIEDGSGWSMQIASIATVGIDRTMFTPPAASEISPTPTFGGATTSKTLGLDPAAFATALPSAVWLGRSVDGAPLIGAASETLVTRWEGNAIPPSSANGLHLSYGTASEAGEVDRVKPFVELLEATSPQYAYQWGQTFTDHVRPGPGQILLETAANSPMQVGLLVTGGIYTTIEASSRELLLSAARELQPTT